MTAGRLWRWSVLKERGSQPQRTLRTGKRSRLSSRVCQRDGQTCWTRPAAGKIYLRHGQRQSEGTRFKLGCLANLLSFSYVLQQIGELCLTVEFCFQPPGVSFHPVKLRTFTGLICGVPQPPVICWLFHFWAVFIEICISLLLVSVVYK